jgi:hypothetical protein
VEAVRRDGALRQWQTPVGSDGRGGLLKLQRREEVVRRSPFEEGKGRGWCSLEEGSGSGETQNSGKVDLNPATETGQHSRGGWRGFALARVATKSGAGRENE